MAADRLTQHTIAGADGTKITFTTAPEESASEYGEADAYMEPVDLRTAHMNKDTLDGSFSTVFEDYGLHDLVRDVPTGRSHSQRVTFNSRISLIPTTEDLQRVIEATRKDSAAIQHGMYDLDVHVASLRTELHHLLDEAVAA